MTGMQWILSDTPQVQRDGYLCALAGRTAQTSAGADTILADPDFLYQRTEADRVDGWGHRFLYGVVRGEPVRVLAWHADLYYAGQRPNHGD